MEADLAVIGPRDPAPERDRYVVTAEWLRLAACRSFGMDPFGPWFDNLSPGQRAVLIAFERAELARTAT